MELKQSRWKSPILWTAVIVQLFLICDTVGLWQSIGLDRSVASTVIDALLQLLVIVGVLNNPTDKKDW
jgi:phi LC3 family holin